MAEIRTVTTLRRKRDEIEASIANYEAKLAQARADLAHINAAITIFEASGDASTLACYVDLHRLFKYGETTSMCKAALASGPKNTREIAAYIIGCKGLDAGDKVLAKTIAKGIIHALRQQSRAGAIIGLGKQKAARIWRLP
jgi:hypothetical protein